MKNELLPEFQVKNQHEYFLFANEVLQDSKYLTSGQVIKEAVKQALELNIGGGLVVSIEPDNWDSTMFCFIKTGRREIEYIGTAR